ncbi:hypothetical protein LX36DRAFT_550976, partial [Colletotrichum falcatum]
GLEVRALHGRGPHDPIVGHDGVRRRRTGRGRARVPLLGRRVGVKWPYRACGPPPSNYPGAAEYGQTPARVRCSSTSLPLLCAGLTMMGAVLALDGELSRGDRVIVQGAGRWLG